MKNVAILNTCISGSTGKIAVGLYQALKKEGYHPFFYYGRQDGPTQEDYYRVGNSIHKYLHAALAKATGLQGYGSVFPTIRTVNDWIKRQIDTVYIVSPHGYYINEKTIWKHIAKNHLKTIYLMIDEYAFLGNCGYGDGCRGYLNDCRNCPHAGFLPRAANGSSKVYKMKEKMYAECDDIVFVGPQFTVEQAGKSPLMKNQKMVILDEAINTSFYVPLDTEELKKELGIDRDDFVCVCVAPYTYERKGCKYFIELARRFEKESRYKFVHVGFNADPKTVPLPANYIPIGFIRDQNELAGYYSLGDLFVFPSLLDTMPNACLESLSAGTPLLCFNVSGMPYIADETVATFVEPKNIDQLEKAVRETKKKDETTINTCRNYALKRYDSNNYYQRLINLGTVE